MRPRNLGSFDQVARLIFGLWFLVTMDFFVDTPAWEVLGSAFLGLYLLLPGLFERCPLYALFGVSTHHPGHSKHGSPNNRMRSPLQKTA